MAELHAVPSRALTPRPLPEGIAARFPSAFEPGSWTSTASAAANNDRFRATVHSHTKVDRTGITHNERDPVATMSGCVMLRPTRGRIAGWLGRSNALPEVRCGSLDGPTKIPQVRVAAASPTRIPRTKRHYAAYSGTAASMVSLALDKPLCR